MAPSLSRLRTLVPDIHRAQAVQERVSPAPQAAAAGVELKFSTVAVVVVLAVWRVRKMVAENDVMSSHQTPQPFAAVELKVIVPAALAGTVPTLIANDALPFATIDGEVPKPVPVRVGVIAVIKRFWADISPTNSELK